MKITCPLFLGLLLLAAPTIQAQLDYTTNNGTITITGFNGPPWAVAIPSNINGYPVTTIGENAFENSVLSSVTIPDSVSSIGDGAFVNCYELTSITVDPGNLFYTSSDGALFDKNQTTLIQYAGGIGGAYSIPGSVTSIGGAAFYDCSLTSVTIPNSVTNIGDSAFVFCGSLTSVTIPSSVTSIGELAFSGCGSLTNITVAAGDSFYSSMNGVLFDKNQTMIVAFPNGVGGSYTIPNTVTSIGDSAFESSGDLTSVTIPASVTNIAEFAFAGCALTGVTMPASLTSIGKYVFLDCTNLAGVYFHGNAPAADSSVFSGDKHTTVYYSYGTTGWHNRFAGRPAVLWKGAMEVTITPAGAVSAGAEWRANGGAFKASEVIVTNLSPPRVIVSFKSIAGWITPSNQEITIASGQTNTLVASYVGKPDLSISSPKPEQSVSNEPFVIAGTVADKVAVEQVFYKLNGASWTPANSTNLWTNWTATVANLNPGANTLSAYVVDDSGSATTNKAFTFKYVPSAILDLKTNGIGAVTPNDGGKWLEIGTKHTLTASAGQDWIFSNWVASGSEDFVTNNPVLKFIMQSNLVLTANFAPNPFLPEKGTFIGLFLNPTNVTEASSGFFTLNLTTSGAFSGKITLPGGPYSFAEKFDPGGQVQFTIPHAKPSPITVNLQLDINEPTNEQITGTISNAVWTAGLTADRAVFSASTNKAADYEGQFTLAIPGNTSGVGSPGGFGWAALTISPAGAISMNGSLADGTAINQSSVSVTKDGRWPLYAPYKNPPTTSVGAVFGWMMFSNLPASTLGGDLYWFRPEGATPKTYPSGFTNLTVPVIGSRFELPNDAPVLNLTNGEAILEGGTLSSPLTNDLTISSKNTLDVTSVSNALILKLTTSAASAGKITGGFAYPGSGTKADTTISGVVLQEQNEAVGCFLRTNQSGAFLLDNP